jgi:rhodanese-related sulfurtransferase
MFIRYVIVSCFMTFGLLAQPVYAATAATKEAGKDAKEVKDAAAAAKAAFPLRSQYLDVTVIETADLARRYGDVVIVDVRTKYEYDTLKVKDALLIDVTERTFVEQVRQLRQKTDKPIVFYCNGKTCRKSYDAVLATLNARIPNVLCYDAGIADWAKAQPDKTTLLGKSPVKPEELISHDNFKKRLLAPKEFEAKVEGKSLVLDVRSRAQRDSPLFPFRELRAPLGDNAAIDPVIEQAKREKKTLLVYDQVGKQVEWFQYYLEAKGVKDYYFMKGGAQAYSDATLGKVSLGEKK